MPALPKPHRVAFLVPEVGVEGADAAFAREAALLLWVACIDACQRHPGLAVYDAESTPMFPLDAHFAPQHAAIGATPTDSFYGSTRRDELMWLELGLSKPGAVRLHVLGRDGKRASFDALGKNLGEQINQVLGAWLSARKLGPLPRRFEAIGADEILALVRVLAPPLIEEARAWAQPVVDRWARADAGADTGADADTSTEAGAPRQRPVPDRADTARDGELMVVTGARSSVARSLAKRVPGSPLKVAALRLLELTLREPLGELILAVDAEHPQALFARFAARRDLALLRRVIAAAPGWARPYASLERRDDEPGTPSELEAIAGAGIVALCRPGQLDVLETVAARLAAARLADEGVRLLERARAMYDDDARAHIALVDALARTGREGIALDQALASSRAHGCPMDPSYPWDPDQIIVDLLTADALHRAGRLDEAIALRANRLEGREATWPRHTRVLAGWKKDAKFVAWAYAREGAFRGDPARAVEGFGRIEPGDDVDVATFLDALIATGHEHEVALAWAQLGLGARHTGPVARLAAARALLAAGEWRRGLEELWRVELAHPGRDEHVAIAHCGLLLSCAPLDVVEAVLGEHVVLGATTLVRRMARDVADFVPGAADSSVIARGLGKLSAADFDPSTLAGFASDTRSKRALDALFGELGPLAGDDAIARADRLVNRWLDVAFTEASEDDAPALAQAAAYAAGQALGRYLAATTAKPSPIAGALRTVAAEALALVRTHRAALGDREARALLGVLEGQLRRVDRWVGNTWLAAVERAVGLDERAGGDLARFAAGHPTCAARLLGPEETAVLAASIARLHRERPANWAAAVDAQATQLAVHTGHLGADEWADAIVAQLAAKEVEVDDAIDALQTAAYLAEGISAGPALHLARVLLDAGRGPAAAAALVAGLHAASPAERDRELAALAEGWTRLQIDLPLAFADVAAQMFTALQRGEPARAERLGRWAIALDPHDGEAHRNLGLAFAHQGKVADALAHLRRSTREQATQILAGVLYQSGKLPEAMAVLDYASRWYVRAEQWLTYGGIAYAAMDTPRTVRAYALAYQLDPDAFDVTQLHAYAGVLDEVGDHATCEAIANRLLRAAGDDLTWKTNGWNHLACAFIGQGKFAEAEQLARDALEHNPVPDNAGAFQATLDRARARTVPTPPASIAPPREPVFAQLDTSDLAAAADHARDPSWRVRRAALEAARFRYASENGVPVTPRARAAARAILDASVGLVDVQAMSCRALALHVRAQAYFARDPLPPLGDRMTRDAFYQEFRARGGVVLGEPTPAPPPFVDRVVISGGKVARASDYVALLRDLAALAPRDALAEFDLDEAGYLEVARAWAAAFDADPTLAATIAAGLAKR